MKKIIENLPGYISGWCMFFGLVHSSVHILHEVVVVHPATLDVRVQALQSIVEKVHQHSLASTHGAPKVDTFGNLNTTAACPSERKSAS